MLVLQKKTQILVRRSRAFAFLRSQLRRCNGHDTRIAAMPSEYWFYTVGPVVRPSAHPRAATILPQLIVGEYPRPDDAVWLRDTLRVTSVVCLQDAIDLAGKSLALTDLESAYAQARIGFDHLPIPDGDIETFAQRLPAVVTRVASLIATREVVYLHCNAGMNRAPTVAVAYLYVHQTMPLAAARDFVKQRHACVPYMTMLEKLYGTKHNP
jgi:protein-tyrosine phosphatase